MEFLVEKIGMSRTIDAKSTPVTLLRVLSGKICEFCVQDPEKPLDPKIRRAIVAYERGKAQNKAISGAQKKYGIPKNFNKFATLITTASEPGDLPLHDLADATRLKITFQSKGRGFSGVIKRWNFQGGPGAHGSRFHRRPGSIGNREFPGRVQKGKKMPGHYGNDSITVQNDVISFNAESQILVVKGSVAGHGAAFGKVQIIKRRENQ